MNEQNERRSEDISVRLVQDLVNYGHMEIQDNLKIQWMSKSWLPSIGCLDVIERMKDGENFERKNFKIRLYIDNIYSIDILNLQGDV